MYMCRPADPHTHTRRHARTHAQADCQPGGSNRQAGGRRRGRKAAAQSGAGCSACQRGGPDSNDLWLYDQVDESRSGTATFPKLQGGRASEAGRPSRLQRQGAVGGRSDTLNCNTHVARKRNSVAQPLIHRRKTWSYMSAESVKYSRSHSTITITAAQDRI